MKSKLMTAVGAAILIVVLVALPLAAFVRVTPMPMPTEGPGWRRIGVPEGEISSRMPSWIEVDAPEGYKLPAAVFRPSGEGPFPVVLVLHGTAGLNSKTILLGEEFANTGFLTVVGAWFSENGLWETNPKSAASSPITVDSPHGPPFSGVNLDSIKYVKALVNAAKTLLGADSHNVGLLGVSRGANAGLLVASTDGIQAVVANSGSGEVYMAIDTPPMDVVETLAAPVLILHGTADQTAPIENISKYERALKQRGKPHEVYYYEGAPHAVTQWRETRADAGKHAVDFFTKYLAPASTAE